MFVSFRFFSSLYSERICVHSFDVVINIVNSTIAIQRQLSKSIQAKWQLSILTRCKPVIHWWIDAFDSFVDLKHSTLCIHHLFILNGKAFTVERLKLMRKLDWFFDSSIIIELVFHSGSIAIQLLFLNAIWFSVFAHADGNLMVESSAIQWIVYTVSLATFQEKCAFFCPINVPVARISFFIFPFIHSRSQHSWFTSFQPFQMARFYRRKCT